MTNFDEYTKNKIKENWQKTGLLEGCSIDTCCLALENQRLYNLRQPDSLAHEAQMKRISIPIIRRLFGSDLIKMEGHYGDLSTELEIECVLFEFDNSPGRWTHHNINIEAELCTDLSKRIVNRLAEEAGDKTIVVSHLEFEPNKMILKYALK